MLPHIALDDGVAAVETVLVPEPLEDALGGVTLLLENPLVIVQNLVDDASKGIILSLSKGWADVASFGAGSPAALNRPASCAPCPGATRTSVTLPECSSPPPSPPGEPADMRPPGISVAPSIGSTTTLWMTVDGTVFIRKIQQSLRPHGPIYLRRLHQLRRIKSLSHNPAEADAQDLAGRQPLELQQGR